MICGFLWQMAVKTRLPPEGTDSETGTVAQLRGALSRVEEALITRGLVDKEDLEDDDLASAGKGKHK